MAKVKREGKRPRILYCSGFVAHRFHRELVSIAETRGWILNPIPAEHMQHALESGKIAFDGVISHLNAYRTGRLLNWIGTKPHVTLHHETAEKLKIPGVVMDHAAAGKLVADHFGSLHFTNYAVFGLHRALALRASGLDELASRTGHPSPLLVEIPNEILEDYGDAITHVGNALRTLPMPLAIMAANDRVAVCIMHACELVGLSIPSQVAICGFDNDPIACDLAPVPLSSVDTNPELQAREAACLLQDLLEGKNAPSAPIMIPPKALVVRRSSGVVASKNLTLAKALAYIHQHAWTTNLSVPEIAEEIGVAETTLYAAFRNELSLTPLQYITALRVKKAQRLLKTNQKICDIRPECGFASDYQMYKAFKRETGKPPGAFR